MVARVRTGGPGAAGGRLGEGSELERGGAPAATAATAAAKRPCCVVCGAGGGGRRRREQSRARRRERHHTRHKMAGEAAATRAVRRSAAAHGLASALGAAPGRPGGLRGSEGPPPKRGGRARVREPAAEVPGKAWPATPVASLRQPRVRGREAAGAVGGRLRRASSPGDARKSEPKALAVALRPGELLPRSLYCPLSLGGKARRP